MTDFLIAGAGPVGLAGALFLKNQGLSVRIIDPLLEPTLNSRALAVNPRTLDILAKFGLVDEMLKYGQPMRAAELWDHGKSIAKIQFKGLHKRYPFMLALSQAVTERLLAEKLTELDVVVERGQRLTRVLDRGNHIEAVLEREGTAAERVGARYLLAADGAHSAVRHQIHMPFEGESMSDEWHLADVKLDTPRDPLSAHIEFPEDGGFLFMIRTVVDARIEKPPYLWRVISSRPELLQGVLAREALATPVWESRFKVSHRIAKHLRAGRVFLAGDAAHIHSPVGARGMNLGIEDVWTLSALYGEGRLDQYDRLRREVDVNVVKTVDRISKLAATRSVLLRSLRPYIVQSAMKLAPLRNRFVKAASGLDHKVPGIEI